MKAVRNLKSFGFFGPAIFFGSAIIFLLQTVRYFFPNFDEQDLLLQINISKGGMILGIGITLIFARVFDDMLIIRLIRFIKSLERKKRQGGNRQNS